MATSNDCTKNYREHTDLLYNPLHSLSELFKNLSNHLSYGEIHQLTMHTDENSSKSYFSENNELPSDVQIRNINGSELFSKLFKAGECDESNFSRIRQLLKRVQRHDLLCLLDTRKKRKLSLDPYEKFLQTHDASSANVTGFEGRNYGSMPGTSESQDPQNSGARPVNQLLNDDEMSDTEEPVAKRLRNSSRQAKKCSKRSLLKGSWKLTSRARKKYTCDVHLHVRVEYVNPERMLEGNVFSTRVDLVERQLDCFSQATSFLSSRDLSYVVCNIKFSKISFLDAFWRDYLTGSLATALRGFFITDTLRQIIGNETVKLVVYINEEEYTSGRKTLLKNYETDDN